MKSISKKKEKIIDLGEKLAGQIRLISTLFKIFIFSVCAALIYINYLKYITGIEIPFKIFIILHIWFFANIAFFVFFKGSVLKTVNGLIELKNRFAAKSGQLENMAQALSKKVAENKYLKSITTGYIAKKEAELDTTKNSLEKQIEELKKTQKAMYFMIEDLNSMSAQLKDGRDHLEEKVKERTDELLKIGEKLHRNERLAFLGKLAGSITHELKNSLAAVKSAAYCLDKALQEKKNREELKYTIIIDKGITLIDSIINDIMGFAKVSPLELTKVNPEDIIEEVIALVDVPRLVEIKKEFQKLPEINVDKRRLIHALTNITNNAIMAMKGSGKLIFRVIKHKETHVCFQVEDTGSGIPETQKDLIFEPLYSSRPKGTGLGLSIAKMMIELQGGYIEFESVLDRGTIFKVFLPMDLEEKKEKSG